MSLRLVVCLSAAAALPACSGPREPAGPVDPVYLSFDLRFTPSEEGPLVTEIATAPGRLVLTGRRYGRHTCDHFYPMSIRRAGELELTLTYPPKGLDCRDSVVWFNFSTTYALAAGRYAVRVTDERLSTRPVIERVIRVP